MPQSHLQVLIVCLRATQAGHYWPCTVALANALSRRGVAVHIVAPAQMCTDGLHEAATLHVAPLFSAIYKRVGSTEVASLLETIYAQWAIHGRLRETHLDCVHFINGRTILTTLLTLLSDGCGVVNSPYGFPESKKDVAQYSGLARAPFRLRDWLARKAIATGRMAVVCETRKVYEAYQPTYGQHVHEIPYSISDPNLAVHKAEARQELGLPADRFIFLLFGTHREGKDYATVLKALGATDPSAMALFAGALISGNDPHVLAKELPPERVSFVDGFMSERTMALCFLAADFVVIPYEGGFERGSGVLLEACRYCRPVIATDTGYLRSFLMENEIGLLYRSGDVASLTAAMNHAMQDGTAASFKPSLRRTADTHSWGTTVTKYLQLYEQYSPAERNILSAALAEK